MAVKKTTTKKVTNPQVVERDIEEINDGEDTNEVAVLEEVTPAEQEVIDEDGEAAFPTFTVTINGEEFEIEDRFRGNRMPGAFMMLGHPKSAQRYSSMVLEQIIGEDQIVELLEEGIDVDELSAVIVAWADSRGLKN